MELEQNIAEIPESRKSRFESIRKRIQILYPTAKESMRYKMPTYEFAGSWVALANQNLEKPLLCDASDRRRSQPLT